ncbi:MAG: hypothetical protein ACD_67C00010G0001 [uncultured bacterium]|nr:MAG: hypothetical protein ACD_67C00010G0001 [uncultured bacterium]
MENKKTTIGQLENFVEQLISEKGLEYLDSEVLTQIKSDLISRIEDRINVVILANMPPEKLDYFEKLLDQAQEEEIQSFCNRSVPNLDQLIAVELNSFKESYLEA